MKIVHYIITFLILAIAAPAFAQDDMGDDEPKGARPLAPEAPKKAEGVSADELSKLFMETVEEKMDYTYNGGNLSDPFVPPIMAIEKDALALDDLLIPIISPLQKHDVSRLQLVGIWDGREGRRAMIMTPQNEGVVVEQDDPVGDKGGILYAIDKDKVSIREYNFSPDGTREFDDKILFLEGGGETSETSFITIQGGKGQEPYKEGSKVMAKFINSPSGSVPVIENKADLTGGMGTNSNSTSVNDQVSPSITPSPTPVPQAAPAIDPNAAATSPATAPGNELAPATTAPSASPAAAPTGTGNPPAPATIPSTATGTGQ